MLKRKMNADLVVARFRRNLASTMRSRGSQKALASKAGLVPHYISLLTSDRRSITPSLGVAIKIASALGYTPGEFLLRPTEFAAIEPGPRGTYSVRAFVEALNRYLESGPRGSKTEVAAEAQMTVVRLSQLLRTAKDESAQPIDPTLKSAVSLAWAIGQPIDDMCQESSAPANV